VVIANQLVGSLASGNQSDYYDAALYYSKWYTFRVRFSHLLDWSRYRRLTHSPAGAAFTLLRDVARMLFVGLNLLLTKGGTSVTRLVLIFLVLNVFVAPLLLLPQLSLKHADCLTFSRSSSYVERVAASAELFLAYGYTNYSPQDPLSHITLTAYALLGIVWYAFLVTVHGGSRCSASDLHLLSA
jgi:hypothetical protein